MEQQFVNELHTLWEAAKKQAQTECERRSLSNMAEKYRACRIFKGSEDLEQLVALFTSPQGMEFCQSRHFPDLNTLRRFKPYNVERFGVYIDAGQINLHNATKVVLIGDTSATLTYDNRGGHEVFLMHGAQAAITASGWAMVFVTSEDGCAVIKTERDRAKIL